MDGSPLGNIYSNSMDTDLQMLLIWGMTLGHGSMMSMLLKDKRTKGMGLSNLYLP